MAANLGLVPHAAERDARELAAQRVRHALAERGFADPGRTHQAKNRAFDLFPPFDDGDELQQAVLDFFQAEMLFVQNPLGGLQIQFVVGLLFPRQAQNPVEVIARNGVFGGGGRRLLEPFQFLHRGLARLVGHRRLLDLAAQRLDFIRARVGFAQFALNGPHLLAQKKVALGLGNGRGDVALDFGTQREHLVLAVEHGQKLLQAFADGNGFEQFLAVAEFEVQVGGDQVGKMAGRVHVHGGDLHVVGQRD